ncbi:hypothetical protein [Actomonas aquatica]|uniref:Uncharacterized protein n=1 Tax=Actomonas aquatica TaxID=2866162 RepID=A0ABZ1CEX6_9BACT|nr:hypothetical protein [Opitutus sp. WL0086]WRQ90001.1 hypothetical protein K1X11_011335 [Opitutus sp. WL0086]
MDRPLLPPFADRRVRTLLAYFAGLTLLLPLAQANRRVAVKATAEDDYVAERYDANGNRIAQTYVFLEGTFHGGAIRDRSLERAEIQEIARTLAPYLAEKDFLPTDDAGNADIVIAIHWGTTVSLKHNSDYVSELMIQARDRQMEAQEFYQNTYMEDGEETIPTDYAQGLLQDSARQAAEAPDYEWARLASTRSERDFENRPTATLLGFSDVLNRDMSRAVMGEDARTVNAMLEEDRYFVVLAAYDLKNRGEDGTPQRLWVARLSTRSAGTNFTEALDTLGEVGSNYFGEHHPDLAIERKPVKVQNAEVEVGDPIVVEDPQN